MYEQIILIDIELNLFLSKVVILIDDKPDDPDYLTLLYVGRSRAMVKLLVLNVV